MYTSKQIERETLVVSEATRKTMRGNRGSNTKPELLLRRELWKSGMRGYRVNVRTLPGKPDVVFTKRKLAIFVHGCFWHGCTKCENYRTPKTNSEFWSAKLRANKERDARAEADLVAAGYRVVTLWECELESNRQSCISQVMNAL